MAQERQATTRTKPESHSLEYMYMCFNKSKFQVKVSVEVRAWVRNYYPRKSMRRDYLSMAYSRMNYVSKEAQVGGPFKGIDTFKCMF